MHDQPIIQSGANVVREPSIPAAPPYADECAKAAAMQSEEAAVLEDTLRRQHDAVMATIEVLVTSSDEAQRQIKVAIEAAHLRRRAIEAAISEFDQSQPKAKAMDVESLGAISRG
jgi:hypothetical protein